MSGREFLLWRMVHFQGERQGNFNKNGDVSELRIGEGDQVMILGFEIPRESRMLSAAKRSIVLTLVVAVLFVTASLIAWIMVIRSRLLAGQLEAERARRAHLEELGLAAAGLAHETKNPLGIILGLAQQISDNPEEPEQSRVMLEHIMDQVDKAQARLGNFMTFARQRKVNAISLDAREVCAKVAEILRPDFDAVGVKLEMTCPSLRILADEEMLRQVLVNLLLNSLHASSAGSKVTVWSGSEGKAGGAYGGGSGKRDLAGVVAEHFPALCVGQFRRPWLGAGHCKALCRRARMDDKMSTPNPIVAQ